MKFKNWLLKEEYLKTGSAIIYHRTSKEALSGIIATGFQAGGGAMYGQGFYATLDLESQNNDYMLSSYGDTITKWFIPHLNHFVIFNPILANMVHGTSSIEEQLKKIVGENLPQLDTNVSNYTKIAKSAPNALKFSQDYLDKLNAQQKDKIAGLIFSGENDGNIFVAYNNDEIVFNGFIYAPSIMNSAQLNKLKTGHGWQSRVDSQRIKDVYQMPKDDKRSGIASGLNKNIEELSTLNDKLIRYAYEGKLDFVKFMIKKGANDFKQAMDKAGANGHIKIVELMIGKGANDFNHTMISAAENGHLDIVKLMIEKGANGFKQAMRRAAYNGHLDVVKLMTEKGVNDNDFERSAIDAANRGHIKIVKFMVEKGLTSRTIRWMIEMGKMNNLQDIVEYLQNYMKENGIS